MTAPSKKIYSVGFNGGRYFLLSSGYPAATNATVYSGVSLGGPNTLTLETAAPEIVLHPGWNGVAQYDVLPGNGIQSGSMTLSREDADAIAAFTNTSVHVIASSFNAIGWNTSQQGTNPVVGLMVYDQAKDDSGNRVWRTHMIPRCIITPRIKGLDRSQQNITYDMQPLVSTAYLTGYAFTTNNNGFLSAQVVTLTSNYRLNLATWKATSPGGLTAFDFDTDLPKVATGNAEIAVYKNGVLMSYGADADTTHYQATTTTITFGAALTAGDIVCALYGIADSAVDRDT